MSKKETQNLKIKTRQTKKLKLKAEQIREGVRQIVIEKGYVHFRVKPEFYRLLFEIADAKHVPLGVLCRQWVAERAQQEMDQMNPVTERRRLNGRAGRSNSSVSDIPSLVKRIDRLEVQLQIRQKLDEDFVAAVKEKPKQQKRPALDKLFK